MNYECHILRSHEKVHHNECLLTSNMIPFDSKFDYVFNPDKEDSNFDL